MTAAIARPLGRQADLATFRHFWQGGGLMRGQASRSARIWTMLAVLAAGGLLPADCVGRARQAYVDGTKSFLASTLFNPEFILDSAFPQEQDEEETE